MMWTKFRIAIAIVALPLLGGCAAANPIVESGPEPRVADCALIKQATPTLYACDGKVYTGQQLWAIRHGEQTTQ
jgi:hypothetical protein